ncbi:MAG: hypothetical protein WA196_08600, partial [Pseudolabrys sp.]
MCTNCRRARGYFLQLRPRQPLPPSRFELRFGLVERCRVAAVRISAGLPKMPVQRPEPAHALR